MRRPLLAVLICSALTFADYCGNNKIPYGLEVHKNGRIVLLCTKPNCHEKKYAECPERADSNSCQGNSTWIGGIERYVDGSIALMCCNYDLLATYGEPIFKEIIVHRGEFFEGEEKTTGDSDDVVSFDLITNIRQGQDERGEFYALSIKRYHCGRITSEVARPAWIQSKHWPYWE